MLDLAKIMQSVLDNSPEAITILSTDFKTIAFNSATQDLISKISDKKINVGNDFREFISPQNLDLFVSSFLKACEGEKISSKNDANSDRINFYFEYNFAPIFDDNGKVAGIYFSIKNKDREKKAETEIERLSKTIDSIFKNTTESFILLDENYTLLNFNKVAAEKIRENSGKTLSVGANFKDYIHKGREEIFIERFKKTLKGKSFVSEEELRIHNGNHIWVQTRMQPIYSNNEKILGVSIFWHYITEKKLAEIALQESEEKFRRIVETTPVPIIITDNYLNILISNKETTNVFGYTEDVLKNKQLRLLIPQKRAENNRDKINENSKRHADGKHTMALTIDKKELYVDITLKRFQFNHKKFFIVIIQNITERVQHEQLISDQIKKLEAIAWHHSHVIRRPLANILGAYNLLQATQSEKEKHEYLTLLYQSTKELDKVIEDIVIQTKK